MTLTERIHWNVTNKIYPRLGSWRPDLRIADDLFTGFQDEALRNVAAKIQATRFYRSFPGVHGWMSLRERQTLYAFARYLPGPFLEIGSWVGLSTCNIAAGIRDSRERKCFVAAELNPTVANFRVVNDGVGFYYPAETTENMGSCTAESYRDEIEPILKSPGGVIGTLRRNLARAGVSDLVSIHEGHFAGVPDLPYRMIFIDAMHSPREIERNGEHLRPMLKRGVVLACHDLKCHSDNEACLRQNFSYGYTAIIDTMLIGEIV